MKRGHSLGDLNDESLQEATGLFSAVKTRSKKAKKANNCSQNKGGKSRLQENADGKADDDSCDEVALQRLIQSQQQTIDQLITTVKVMNKQLTAVMSFLGISLDDIADVADEPVKTDAVTDLSQEMDKSHNQCPTSYTSISSAEGIGQTTLMLTAEKATRTITTPFSKRSLKEMVVNAIYQDNRSRERRAKSFIVSGLAADVQTGCSDAHCVMQLLESELDIKPNVVFCKRLGERLPGRVQPLLVMLSDASDAAWIIANAKKLRRSQLQHIRDHIYINANLSKEEARAAYEQRCRRRAARAARRGDDDVHAGRRPEHPEPIPACDRSSYGSRTIVNSRRTTRQQAAASQSFQQQTDTHDYCAVPSLHGAGVLPNNDSTVLTVADVHQAAGSSDMNDLSGRHR